MHLGPETTFKTLFLALRVLPCRTATPPCSWHGPGVGPPLSLRWRWTDTSNRAPGEGRRCRRTGGGQIRVIVHVGSLLAFCGIYAGNPGSLKGRRWEWFHSLRNVTKLVVGSVNVSAASSSCDVTTVLSECPPCSPACRKC